MSTEAELADAIDQHGAVYILETGRHSFPNANDMIVSALRAMTRPSWISVQDRMPGNYSTVLTIDSDGIKSTGFWTGARWSIDVVSDSDGVTITPTHWMPLPDGP